MPHGGPRVGAGRPKKPKPEVAVKPVDLGPAKPIELKEGWVEPLVYMMAVYNDPHADESRRDRMAVSAAPYRHSRAEEVGKKQQKQQAAQAVTGTFAMPAAPRLVVSNKK